MLFGKSLLLGAAALASFATAQSALQFTSVFTTVTAGQAVTITWSGGDSTQPVTIALKKGASSNLGTAATLTTTATGGSYQWTPSSSLPSGTDYALQITQGSATNYWGPFALAGGGSPSSSSSIASSASSSSSSVSSAISSAVSSILASNSSIANSTVLSNTTTSMPLGTASSGSIPISANTTFSSPTLSSTATVTAVTTSSAPSTTASVTGSSTPAPTKNSAPALGVSSPLALVLTAIVAMVCLN